MFNRARVADAARKLLKFVFSFLLPAAVQIGGLFILFQHLDERWGALVVIALIFLTAGLGKIPRWADISLWVASAVGYAFWIAEHRALWGG